MLKKMIMFLLMFLAVFGGNPLAKDLDPKVANADYVNDVIVSTNVTVPLAQNEDDTVDGYSSVTDDLDYLEISYSDYNDFSDNSIKFISLLEGYNANGKLDTYVYFRFVDSLGSGDGRYLELKSLNISYQYNENPSFIIDDYLSYGLELVSSYGFYFKYVVKRTSSSGVDLPILDELYKRYSIKDLTYYEYLMYNDELQNPNDTVKIMEINKVYWTDFTSDPYNPFEDIFNPDNDDNENNSSSSSSNNNSSSSSSSSDKKTPYDDLSKAENFYIGNYSYNPTNYTLSLIQIGECDTGQLVLYIYNPTKKLNATSINMSIDGEKYEMYYLSKDSTYECIDKYYVMGFEIKSIQYRYYYIATIYRPYDSKIDDGINNEFTSTNEVGIAIGHNYCCYYDDNKELVYEKEIVNLVEIKPELTSFVRYDESGFVLFGDKACDAHFVAFNVINYDVEKIFDADISFEIQKYKYSFATGGNIIKQYDYDLDNDGVDDPLIPNSLTLTDKDNVIYTGNGLVKRKYTWNRISSSTEFINNFKSNKGKLLDVAESDINKSSWVFSFYESDYIFNGNYASAYDITAEKVKNVVILRLHFLTPGGTYNLGVVSDKTSSTGKPAGSVNEEQADLDKVVDDIKNLFNRFTEAMSLGLKILLFVFGVFILVCIIRLIALLIKPILEALFAPLGLFKKKHKKKE